MRFSRWQAAGNEYLLIERAELVEPLTPERVHGLCGGADGIVEHSARRAGLQPPASQMLHAARRIDQSTRIIDRHGTLLATRASRAIFNAIKTKALRAKYHPLSRAVVVKAVRPAQPVGQVLVMSAGTSDIPVAEEAAVTADVLGSRVDTLYDVGVAGLHRILDSQAALDTAHVLVVVAGMDGVLPSVVGGLVDKPVIAVPTSVGYGASFQGLAALLTMLNSCAAGVAVVNIDNGFGAGVLAHRINALGAKTDSDSDRDRVSRKRNKPR